MPLETVIEWAELHAPLFLAGANLGLKIDPTKRVGLKMVYNEVKRHLYVSYNGKVARVPETSVLSMVEAPAPVLKPVTAEQLASAKPIFDPNAAQVSTPQSHVFAGPGGGTTGQEPPKQKGAKTKAII